MAELSSSIQEELQKFTVFASDEDGTTESLVQQHEERREKTDEIQQEENEIQIGNTSGNEATSGRSKTGFLKYFNICRNGIRKVLIRFFDKCSLHRKVEVSTTCLFLAITFSRLVAGTVKLKSDCPDEKNVAVYLFVKSLFGFLFWAALLIFGCMDELKKAVDNLFIEGYLVIESIWSLIWLIVGTVWAIGEMGSMIEECPSHDVDWNQHFINFAFAITCFDWVCVVAFGFYFCYVLFDRTKVAEET